VSIPPPTPFERALREELVAAARRGPQRRRRWLAAAAAAVAAAIAGVAALVWPSPATADVEVTHRNGLVEVRMVDLETTPRRLAQELADAGVDARVHGEPVGPSNVGRLVAVTIDGPDAREVELIDFESHDHQAFRIPERFRGTLVIGVGRQARPGERWTTSSDAFALGEPLHCRDVRGRPLAEVLGEVAGYHVRLFPVVDGIWGQQQLELDATTPAQQRAWVVTRALYDGGRELLVLVDEHPNPMPAPSTC
jgi:hypothetical protein